MMPDTTLSFRKPSIRGYEEQKIGDTTFLVFENGMVPANDIKELRLDGDGMATIRTSDGAWLRLLLKSRDARQ